MSLDNVLLVASIARENPALLFIGLTFSVLFMGLPPIMSPSSSSAITGSITSASPSSSTSPPT
jgi:hypothetical protein